MKKERKKERKREKERKKIESNRCTEKQHQKKKPFQHFQNYEQRETPLRFRTPMSQAVPHNMMQTLTTRTVKTMEKENWNEICKIIRETEKQHTAIIRRLLC